MSSVMNALLTGNAVLLFVNVFAEQLGAPLPSYPLLVASGASADDPMRLVEFLFLASLACVLADLAWYWAGRHHGERILTWLAKLPFSHRKNAGTCSARFTERGAQWLLVSKFVPGMGAVATLMAGAQRMSLAQFLVYDILGSILWAGSALLLGHTFQTSVFLALDMVQEYLFTGLAAAGLLLAATLLAAHRLKHHTIRRQTRHFNQQTITHRSQPANQLFAEHPVEASLAHPSSVTALPSLQRFNRSPYSPACRSAQLPVAQRMSCTTHADAWNEGSATRGTLPEAS